MSFDNQILSFLSSCESKKYSNCRIAKEAILQFSITRNNLKNSEAFKSFDTKIQQSIRFQLRKKGRGKDNAPQKKQKVVKAEAKKKKEVVSQKTNIFPSILILFVGLYITLFLMTESINFYINRGMSAQDARYLAILVELVIISCAMSSKKRIRLFSYFFLIYNAFTFSFHIYKSDETTLLKNRAVKETYQMLLEEKKIYSDQVKLYKQNLARAQERYDKNIKAKLITKADTVILPLIVEAKEKLHLANLNLRKNFKELKDHQRQKVKSKESVSKIGLETFVLMVFRWALQLVSIIFFHTFSDSFRVFMKEQSGTSRLRSKGATC